MILLQKKTKHLCRKIPVICILFVRPGQILPWVQIPSGIDANINKLGGYKENESDSFGVGIYEAGQKQLAMRFLNKGEEICCGFKSSQNLNWENVCDYLSSRSKPQILKTLLCVETYCGVFFGGDLTLVSLGETGNLFWESRKKLTFICFFYCETLIIGYR